MKPGEVYRFAYLWGHEAERGEESGRKIRRVCLLVRHGDQLYLFPFTSKEPRPGRPGERRLFEPVPEIECRRIGLPAGEATYLVLDDYNRVPADRPYDFDGLAPVGSLSPRFLERVARRFLTAVAERRPLRGTSRG